MSDSSTIHNVCSFKHLSNCFVTIPLSVSFDYFRMSKSSFEAFLLLNISHYYIISPCCEVPTNTLVGSARIVIVWRNDCNSELCTLLINESSKSLRYPVYCSAVPFRNREQESKGYFTFRSSTDKEGEIKLVSKSVGRLRA